VQYRVDVTYDNYPGWLLKQVSTNEIIVEYGYNEMNTEGLSLSESVDLVPGEEYRLVVRDLLGDGMWKTRLRCTQQSTVLTTFSPRATGI
jgi:hypothetical protein